jgi:hypothetical protein
MGKAMVVLRRPGSRSAKDLPVAPSAMTTLMSRFAAATSIRTSAPVESPRPPRRSGSTSFCRFRNAAAPFTSCCQPHPHPLGLLWLSPLPRASYRSTPYPWGGEQLGVPAGAASVPAGAVGEADFSGYATRDDDGGAVLRGVVPAGEVQPVGGVEGDGTEGTAGWGACLVAVLVCLDQRHADRNDEELCHPAPTPIATARLTQPRRGVLLRSPWCKIGMATPRPISRRPATAARMPVRSLASGPAVATWATCRAPLVAVTVPIPRAIPARSPGRSRVNSAAAANRRWWPRPTPAGVDRPGPPADG